jgi:hypothetical protein
MSGVDLQLNWSRPLGNGGGFSMNSVSNFNLKSITQDTPFIPEVENAGYNSCSLQIECQRYDYRLFTTFSYFKGPWNVSLRHQHWPELDNGSCRTNTQADSCLYNTLPDFNLFAVTGGYSFKENYTVRFGIENLLDTEPPCIGQRPENSPFPLDCTRSAGSTYDPLGRRFFMSMTMDF